MKVEQIDHIHVFVKDKIEAANWYKNILGLEPINSYENPLDEGGPFTLSSDGGKTCIALFKRKEAFSNKSTIAYKLSGNSLVNFIKHINSFNVSNVDGKPFSKKDIIDHQYSFSVYFYDLDGNPIEITTYDYDIVKAILNNTDDI
jgi:catechol-2,3-dioxygenase